MIFEDIVEEICVILLVVGIEYVFVLMEDNDFEGEADDEEVGVDIGDMFFIFVLCWKF